MNTATRPLPLPTQATLPFWTAAAQGKLIFQRCGKCKTTHSTPRLFCRHCMAEGLEWETSSGIGS
ncbi:MAG: zinc ribbon domain-containing protein, partial [Ideonella sp.]